MKNTNTSTSSSRGLVARAPALLALVCALAVPTASFARTVSVAAIKDGLATAAFGDADGAAYTLAWGYGAADGGDATNGWAHFETLGAVAADATSRSVALPAGWGDTATHLRFFLLGPNLPAGATRVEYLQSAQTKDSPTQWIDTDVVGKAGVEAEVDFMWTAGSDSTILGSRKDSGDTRFLALHWNGSKIGSSFTTWASFSTLSATASSETRYLARASLADGAQSLSIDGTTKATSAISSSLDTGLDMYLFAANLYGSAKQGVSAKIYSAKIWLDGELKRNFVPCRDAGNVPAMYDFVSGHYFHNGGSGSFTCGDPVGDPIAATSATASTADYGAPDAYLDYVEATGTQSVLLEGCTIGPDYRLVAEYAYPDPIVRKNNCLFGVYKYGMTAGFYYNNSETAPLNFWSGTGGVNGSGGSNQSTQTEVPATPGERQTVVMNLGAGESSIYAADGRKVWSGTLKGSVTADSTSAISLFTASRLSGYNSNAKIYSFRIYDATGALAHHFLPCLKGSVAGLYDKATGRIHYPQGGDLGAGPELPRPAELVEWVQSDGASGDRQLYIDTEVPAKAGVGMTAEMEWATKPAGNGVDNIFCGAGDANAHIWLYDAVADAGNAAATHRFGYYTWKLQLQSNSVVRAGTRYHVEAHQAHGDQHLSVFDSAGVGAERSNGERSWSARGTDRTLYLFANNNDGTAEPISASARLYSLVLTNDLGVVRDFIPCVADNGRAGLYDRVSERVFFPQAAASGATSSDFDPATEIGAVTNSLVSVAEPPKRLRYIESDGTSDFVNLGVIGRENVKMVAEMEWAAVPPGNGYNNVFCGASANGVHIWPYIGVADANSSAVTPRMGYNGWRLQVTGTSIAADTRYRITTSLERKAQSILVEKFQNGTWVVDGEGARTNNDATWVNTQFPLYLFADNAAGTAANFVATRVYSLKLWQLNATSGEYELVRDLVPAKLDSGAAVLWDKVEARPLFNGARYGFADTGRETAWNGPGFMIRFW